jgi:hypothetical protein
MLKKWRKVLYVGATRHLGKRIYQHNHRLGGAFTTVEVIECEDETEMFDTEWTLMMMHHPPLNKVPGAPSAQWFDVYSGRGMVGEGRPTRVPNE